MLRIRVRCQGVSPLLMDRMTEEQIDSLERGQQKPPRPDMTPKEICDEKIYRENGKIGFPQINLYSCCVGAGAFITLKVGGSRPVQLSTGKTTLLPAFLTIEEFFIPLDGPGKWVVDKRRGVNKEGRAVRVLRPRFDDWGFSFTMQLDDKMVNEKLARLLVDYAGSRVGLCAFRPAKKGPFGRFKVMEWEVIEKIEQAEAEISGAVMEEPES